MARSALLILFVVVLSSNVYYWNRIGPGINFGVDADSRYYLFVCRSMLSVVRLRVPADQSGISDTMPQKGPEYMSPLEVRVLHVGLGVFACHSFLPRRFYSLPPSSCGNPLTDPYYPSDIKVITPGNVVSLVYYGLPLWIPLVITAVPVAIMIARARRQHQRKVTGCCLRCGYNLTGNISGVCPECGEPISGARLGSERL